MTPALLALFLCGNALLGLACIPLYIRAAKRRNIVDVPNARSSHATPTPRGGGIFIAAGALLSIIVATTLADPSLLNGTLLASGGLVAAIGFVDDLKTLTSRVRFGGHLLAAGLLIAGAGFANPQGTAELPPLLLLVGFAGLALWIVGCLNLYNFMDGIDGIATGQGLAAATAWLAIALSGGQAGNLTTFTAATLAATLLGGLLAFLFFNWSPARVFMGDGASGFLGFSFAALPLLVADPVPSDLWLKLNLGALALFPFLFDGTFTLFRRARLLLSTTNPHPSSLTLRPSIARLAELTQAHRSHLYQRWTQAGASHRKVASAYTAWAALGAAAALLVHFQSLSLLLAYPIVLIPAAALLLHSRRFPR